MAVLRSAVSLALLVLAMPAAAALDPYVVTPQPLAGDSFAQAADVSADGRRVVGTSYGPGGTTVVLWEDLGLPAELTPGGDSAYAIAISGDGSTVAGARAPGAFRWTAADGLVPLESAAGAAAIPIVSAVSFDGSVWVGSCDERSTPIDFAPVRWSDAGGPQISYLSTAFRGVATDVSGDGSVVVGSVYDGPSRRPFVWTTATGFRFLEDELADAGVDTSGVALDAIYDVHVSADGRTVVGEHFIARIPEPVPEPSALTAGLVALLGLLLRGRYCATRAPRASACTS